MKTFFKVLGITIGSLIALVLLVACLACYVVFTPKRLTPIVNQVADSVLTCPHNLEEVNLTFFRTFPNFGVEVKGLYIINPMEGAQSDTLLAVPDMVLGVDIIKAIDGDIIIRQFALNDVEANLYIAADGQTNFDVLNLPKDTTDQDTTPSSWQLRSISWDQDIVVNTRTLSFVDRKDSLDARVGTACARIAEIENGLRLEGDAQQVDFTMGDTRLADQLHLTCSLPLCLEDTANRRVRIDKAKIAVNEFAFTLDGTATMVEAWTTPIVECDMNLTTGEWHYSSLMALVPEKYVNLIPKEIEVDGDIQLAAHAYGRYDSITMPLVDAELRLKNAAGHYDMNVLPYHFDAIDADVAVHADLNNKPATKANIKRLYAHTSETSAVISGSVTDVLKAGEKIELANPLCQITADMDVSLPDANYWIQSDSTESWLKGQMKGKMHMTTRLNDVLDGKYNRVKINADMALSNLNVLFRDSLRAQVDHMNLHLAAPRKKVRNSNALTADCRMKMGEVHAQVMNVPLVADLNDATLDAAVELDIKDTAALPTIEADFAMADMRADMDTIHADGKNVSGHASIASSRRDKSMPVFTVNFASDLLNAALGKELQARTGKIKIEANAHYKKDEENVLLKWNPRLKFDLQQGHADIAMLGTPVEIPQIKFKYSNREFHIDTSRIVLGKSDFSLAGDVKNLGRWLRNEGELVGALRFTSDYTDINELLSIVNRVNTSTEAEPADEATPAATATNVDEEEGDPFMVPEHVDMSLLTVIRSADIFDQHLHNLGGQVFVKDGKLIVEEMGFICEAAKLQLTAMYKTPRRNHIYVGFDYHMVDIDLQQLIAMIPQLDTLVPMLKEFRGAAQFHIAAETYVKANYDIKYSTLRGACSIEGKDLKLLDNETFSSIAKILMFNKKTENKIDSISTQIALYKDEVTVYPFCISMDNYMAAVGGNHYLDMNFNYHASLLKPFYLGVDVKGNMDDLKIKPAKCRYAKDFRPLFHRDAEDRSEELRKIISSSLKKNVKIQ